MYEQLLASGDEEKADEFRQKAAELVGIVYTTEEKKVDKETVEIPVTRFDSVDYVWFLHNSFETIGVSDNIAMYNFTEHHYDFVTADVYLSFFKQILDMLDVKVWRQKREQEYATKEIHVDLNEYDTIGFASGMCQHSLSAERERIAFKITLYFENGWIS